mgnify:CR=1 FL=1
MDNNDWKGIKKAVETIQAGEAKRVNVSDNIIVYRCGTVIRIDIK